MKKMIVRLLPVVGAASLAMPAAAQNWEAPPAPPAGAAPNQSIPAHDAAGGYQTPNRDLSAEEKSWHMRAALNVAALGCRDAQEAQTIAAYNAMLARHRATLAVADAGVKARYRIRYGAGWADSHDRQMTRVYNFFAQPTAKSGFCQVAREVLAEVNQVSPQFFADFAAESLPRLEAPFLAFYRQYESYQLAYAEWRNRGQMVAMAAQAAPPVTLARLP